MIGVLGGCKKSSVAQNQVNQDDLIHIGEVGSMTGADAGFGISTHQGILLALDEVNTAGGIDGRKLELHTLDDQGKPSEAVLAIKKLITQLNVQAVLGEVASTLSIAMAPIAQQFKVPMISPSSINSKVTEQGDYIFRVCFVDHFQSRVMADFALNFLHAKKAAILRDMKSDYSMDSADLFTEIFRKGGGSILLDQSYSSGDMDFKAQLTAIRAAAPDVILVPGYYTEIGLIARQQKELGMKTPLLGGDGWDSPKLREIGGSALDGSYFVSHFSQNDSSPHIQNFVQKYRIAYGEAPNGLAALGYDSARVLVDSLKRAKQAGNATQTRDEVRDRLRKSIAETRDFQGVTGKISIGPDRNAIKAAVVFKLTDGGKPQMATLVRPD